MNIIQTVGAALIPAVVWFVRMYSDANRKQVEALLLKNKKDLTDLITTTKEELAETIVNIQTDMVANKTADQYRDKAIEDLKEEQKAIKKKLNNI